VVYTSTRAERDLWFHSEAQERREIEEIPDVERQEVREIYQAHGFQGHLLDEAVENVTSDKERWVRIMMTEELGLPAEPPKPALKAGVVTFVAGLVGALIPLIPFALLPLHPATVVCGIVSLIVLFGLGSWKGRVTGRPWWRDGFQFVLVAGLAALAAVGIGALLRVNPGG